MSRVLGGLWAKSYPGKFPKKKDKEVQCHRCQKCGHVSRNCSSMFKCVKCDQKHGPGECKRTHSEVTAPHCVNCGEPGHPANWRGCPSFKEYAKNRRQRILDAQQRKVSAAKNVSRVAHSSLYNPACTFAQLFKGQDNSPPPQGKHSAIISEFLKLANLFLQPEELSLEQEINNFMVDFRSMSRQDAKTEFLRLFKKVKSTYGP